MPGLLGVSIVSLPAPATVADYTQFKSDYDSIPGGFSIADTAANITPAIATLNDSHINSIAVTSGVVSVTVATFASNQTTLDKITGGFAISDTAANIVAALTSLNDSDINSISVTSGVVAVSVSSFAANQTTLDKITGGFTISDTAANLSSALPTLTDSHITSLIVSDNQPVQVDVAELSADATQIGLLTNASGGLGSLALVDTSNAISGDLDNLNGANIASITISDGGAIATNVAQLTSDAVALSKIANVGGSPFQINVTDTAAHIAAGIATLEADLANIESITATGGVVSVSIATLTADQGALDKIVGGFSISDTAANLSSALPTLTDSQITSLVVSDNQPVQVDIAELSADATQIGLLTNASGGPASLAIVDTASAISADLDNLNGADISSITVSDGGPLAANLSQLTSDATALSKIVDTGGSPFQIDITDTAANIEAGLATLQADLIHIGSITATGRAVDVDAATFAADQGALDKVAGGFDVSDSLPNLVSHMALFNADPHILELFGTSGVATISGGVPVNAPKIAISGAGTALTVAENLTLNNLALGAGATVSVATGDLLTLSGAATLAGKVIGAGGLSASGGVLTVSATPTVGSWSNANETINTTVGFNYAGNFSAGPGVTLNVAGGPLSLLGAATFAGGAVAGSRLLQLRGATTVSGAETFGGSVGLSNLGTLTESGAGAITLGDSSGAQVSLVNAASGVIDIINNNGVKLGNGAAATISNVGLIEKTGGGGLSVISPSVNGAGTIASQIGLLELAGASNLISGSLTGVGKIYFGGGGTTTLATGTTASVAGLRIADAGTTVRLQTNLTYGGAFVQAGNTSLLLSPGVTLTLTGASTLGGRISGASTLAMVGGSATINSNAVVTTSNWASSGTTLTIGGAHNYAGVFSASSETINLHSPFKLAGASTLDDVKLVGETQLRFNETATISDGLTIGGKTVVVNASAVTQSGGDVVMGDSANHANTIFNTGAATVWNITDDSSILRGNSQAAFIKNRGVLEKSGGSGVSVVAADVVNGGKGKIEALSGTLDLKGAVTGKGFDVIGTGATLQFDSSVNYFQTVQFQGSGGTLNVNDWGSFAAPISGFAAGDAINVSGDWDYVGFIQSSGVLRFSDNGAFHAVKLIGNFDAADFHSSLVAGSTHVTYG